ncbi:endonuclease/exonuclease/phosphatase family protein [Deinococcus multiflagellatus]|uniref:Endonuclease/exonuclease/phosphatase family protein n=1 Tax=Deinococcus multiflagellatus TaxID=1656887 RepID=A0ABW1ZHY7_9DEIO|nr:endonuclease/exonuclease/phosphatase family protein [Deinococcus multiflagellatus]MBZ9714607.1 endonuclease/exonuclease/phosphatase family protein [Deinococcus multiflagellatus]
MQRSSRRARWWPRVLLGLGLLGLALAGLVYALTDHPRSVQAAELTCPAGTPTLKVGQPVKVLSWNVQYLAGRGYVFFYDTLAGDGPDTRPTPDSLARTLNEVTAVIQAENPDLILLQEVDRGSKRTDYADQLAQLQARLGGAYPCAASAYYHRAAFVPHPKIMGKVGLSLVTLSRYRLDTATRYALPPICGDPLTVAFNFKRAVLGVTLPVAGGRPLTAYQTHLDAFAQGCDTMERQVAAVQARLRDTPGPWIMGGDFNLLGTAGAYARLRERERAYFNPQTELKPLMDAYDAFPNEAQIDTGESRFFTHFPNDPAVGRPDRTIDYFFFSPGLRHTADRIRQDQPKISDHFAMLTTVAP